MNIMERAFLDGAFHFVHYEKNFSRDLSFDEVNILCNDAYRNGYNLGFQNGLNKHKKKYEQLKRCAQNNYDELCSLRKLL